MKSGMGFSSVDGTHMHHVHYRQGVAHLITTYDGNNKCIVLAIAICESESSDTWDYVGRHAKIFGLGRYFSLPDSVIIHDRMKGIERFLAHFPSLKSLECFKHIINNIYAKAGGRSGVPVLWLWELRKAETFGAWMDVHNKIATRSD